MPLPDLNNLEENNNTNDDSIEKELTEEEEEERLLKQTLMIRMEMTDKPEEFEKYYQMSKSVNPFDLQKSMNDILPKRTRRKPSEEELKKMKEIRERRKKRQLEEYEHLIDNEK